MPNRTQKKEERKKSANLEINIGDVGEGLGTVLLDPGRGFGGGGDVVGSLMGLKRGLVVSPPPVPSSSMSMREMSSVMVVTVAVARGDESKI